MRMETVACNSLQLGLGLSVIRILSTPRYHCRAFASIHLRLQLLSFDLTMIFAAIVLVTRIVASIIPSRKKIGRRSRGCS